MEAERYLQHVGLPQDTSTLSSMCYLKFNFQEQRIL